MVVLEVGSQPSVLPEGEITANITIEFPDGTVQEIRDQMLRLSSQIANCLNCRLC